MLQARDLRALTAPREAPTARPASEWRPQPGRGGGEPVRGVTFGLPLLLVRHRCIALSLLSVRAVITPHRALVLLPAGVDEDLAPLLDELQRLREAAQHRRQWKAQWRAHQRQQSNSAAAARRQPEPGGGRPSPALQESKAAPLHETEHGNEREVLSLNGEIVDDIAVFAAEVGFPLHSDAFELVMLEAMLATAIAQLERRYVSALASAALPQQPTQKGKVSAAWSTLLQGVGIHASSTDEAVRRGHVVIPRTAFATSPARSLFHVPSAATGIACSGPSGGTRASGQREGQPLHATTEVPARPPTSRHPPEIEMDLDDAAHVRTTLGDVQESAHAISRLLHSVLDTPEDLSGLMFMITEESESESEATSEYNNDDDKGGTADADGRRLASTHTGSAPLDDEHRYCAVDAPGLPPPPRLAGSTLGSHAAQEDETEAAADLAQAADVMLEFYLARMDGLASRVAQTREELAMAVDHGALTLAARRNTLWLAQVVASAIAAAFAVMSVFGGFFGMNLGQVERAWAKDSTVFVLVTVISTAGCVVVLCAAALAMRYVLFRSRWRDVGAMLGV